MAFRLFLPLLLLLAAILVFSQAQGIGSSASDCCLKHSKKDIRVAVLKSYRLQGPESGCMLRAVVFITKRNKKICASPTDATVQKQMKFLDEKAKKGQPRRPRDRSKKQR
uniref:C-C motif chemokine n=1 Tax=Malurus cyaneus samueli TaxID=2593467 RepID=A0A8C5TLE6_9PASS